VDKTTHELRHGMRDRLRNVICPKSVIDQIGGGSSASIGDDYGEGYALQLLHEWMLKIEG
jgi:hypothetical protein